MCELDLKTITALVCLTQFLFFWLLFFSLGNDALLQSDSAEGSDGEHSDTLKDDVENSKGCEGSSDGEDRGDEDEGDEDGGDEDGGDEDGGDEDGHGGTGNGGWAMAMAKILGKKTPVSTSSILVKNQELDKIKEKAKQELLERKKQVSLLF